MPIINLGACHHSVSTDYLENLQLKAFEHGYVVAFLLYHRRNSRDCFRHKFAQHQKAYVLRLCEVPCMAFILHCNLIWHPICPQQDQHGLGDQIILPRSLIWRYDLWQLAREDNFNFPRSSYHHEGRLRHSAEQHCFQWEPDHL